MKKIAIMGLVGMLAGASQADTFTDATGEIIAGANIDIVSVEVVNDLNDLFFTITLNAANPGWGNYMIGIDTGVGGATDNAWARPVTFNASPIEFWIGTWTDGGGGSQLWSHDGAAWNPATAPANYAFPGDQVTFQVPLADLGLSVGESFNFDVFSSGSGGSDGAVDSLTNPNQTIANWGDSYEAATLSSYTVVPEPASLALLAVGGAMVAMFRRRKA